MVSNQGEVRSIGYLKEWNEVFGNQYSAEHICNYLSRYLRVGSSEIRALDLFSGSGKLGDMIVDFLSGMNIPVDMTYSDIAPRMLHELQENIANKIGNSLSQIERQVVTADVRDLPFESESFDLVAARYGFNNLEKDEWKGALSESLRVLKRGGVLLIQDHFLSGERFAELGNFIECTIGHMEGRNDSPFFPSTEKMNALLKEYDGITFVKTGFAMNLDMYQRMLVKAKNNPKIDASLLRSRLDEMYAEIERRWDTTIFSDNIPVNCVTYCIVKN